MVRLFVKRLLSFLFLIGLLACSKIEKPLNLTPEVVVLDALEVTRNSAELCCRIKIVGTETVSSVSCRYGTSMVMEHQLDCEVSSSVLVSLANLVPNTNYYYCFEVSNGYGMVRSEVCHFTTEPKEAPMVSNLKMLGKGPVSVMLQFELIDNGGEALNTAGFYIKEEGREEKRVVVDCDKDSFFIRLGDLKQMTHYEIQGFAINEIGETRTEKMDVHTESAITVVSAGTLREIIGEEGVYFFNELAVSGPLNGSDVKTLREMMGCTIGNKTIGGRLSKLDLTDVSIVSGGDSYDGSHYTNRDILSVGMFADCLFLEEIKLPYGVVEIERGAFENCLGLKFLSIPALAEKVASSAGCTGLTEIVVDPNNSQYASYDGCLYSSDFSILYWWPERKMQAQDFPGQLRRIENYAFQYAHLTVLDLPSSVKELGSGAFYASKLEHFVVPEKVTNISTGLFQGCNNLKTVWLGKDVGTLSAYSFDGCPLEHLYVPAKEFLPICHEKTFTELNLKNCVLHVPVGFGKLYRNKDCWRNFVQIKEDIID